MNWFKRKLGKAFCRTTHQSDDSAAFKEKLDAGINDWKDKNLKGIKSGIDARGPVSLYHYEKSLLSMVLQLATLIMTLVLTEICTNRQLKRETVKTIVRTNNKLRDFGKRNVKVRLFSGGIARIRTWYYAVDNKKRRGPKRKVGHRGKNGSGTYPILSMLGIKDRITPALETEVALETTASPSMENAKERLSRYGIDLNIKSIQRISENFAKEALELRSARLEKGLTILEEEHETLEGCKVYMGLDGGRTRIRTRRKGRKGKGKLKHGFDHGWSEPKLLNITVLDKNGRRLKKRIPLYDGTFQDADYIFKLLKAHLKRLHIEKAQMISVCTDGAPWIWNRIKVILAELHVNPDRVCYTLDYYHTCEHLFNIAKFRVGWDDKKQMKWAKSVKRLLRDGCIDDFFKEIKKVWVGRNAGKIRKELKYFENHRELLNYTDAKAEGLPIGSGSIESTIRRVVNMRIKGAGKFWKIENAEGFLHLRCYLMSGRWEPLVLSILKNRVLSAKSTQQ